MGKYINTVLTIIGTLLFFGLVNPEILLSDDTVSVQDEDGNRVDDLTSLPHNVKASIAHLSEKIRTEEVPVEYRCRLWEIIKK